MADVKAEIEAQIKKMEDMFLTATPDDIAKCYTDDCRVLPAGAPMIVGKEAFRGFLGVMKQFMANISKVDNKVIDVVAFGEQATSVNTAVTYDKDGKVMDNSKSITLWKKVNGDWFIQWTAWNKDAPTPAQ